ncbi:MAG: hypothetical protein KDH19_18635 [Geminicoccaceae bacterium]|nr:hypothetical protein [Geminicoccaceae bacterium]MCB2013173.1 hypothetical protein [Geminicoccaceae bacterium]
MNEDDFNMSMRKFLKQVGVTSQQEIETALRRARDAGTLPQGQMKARVVLTVDDIGLEHVVEGMIRTGNDG